jgi:hypothetical protein
MRNFSERSSLENTCTVSTERTRNFSDSELHSFVALSIEILNILIKESNLLLLDASLSGEERLFLTMS